jgi:PilZ domain
VLERERRQGTRYAASLEVLAEELVPSGTPDPSTGVIRGTVRNISDRGLCVAWDRIPSPASLVKCRILVAGPAVSIPTLAQVRWVASVHGESLTGMEFLLL